MVRQAESSEKHAGCTTTRSLIPSFGVNQILLRSEVSLRRLNGCVAQQQLDLLKLTAGSTAQLGAGATRMPHAALPPLC